MDTQYSVLLSLYYKEKPGYLRESLDSVFTQTYPSDDVVLVEDGMVGDALERDPRYAYLYQIRPGVHLMPPFTMDIRIPWKKCLGD